MRGFFICVFIFSKRKSPPFGRGSSFFMQVSVSRILLSIVIYLGLELPQGSSDSSVLRQTRSCTRVSILPFHPRLNVGIRHCSQLYPCGRRALPATFVQPKPDCVFGLSSLRRSGAQLSDTCVNHCILLAFLIQLCYTLFVSVR